MNKNRAHVVPNSLTAFSLMCGLFIIFKTNMTEVGGSTFDSLYKSSLLLLLAGFADLLDGAVARAIHAESDFGGNFDSMADGVTFAVVPSVVLLKSLSLEPGTELSFWVTTGAMVYSVCGILRLVRFNSDRIQRREEPGERLRKSHFIGLPIPSAAFAAVSMTLVLSSCEVEAICPLSDTVRAVIMGFVMMVLGYLMICRLRYPSLKSLEYRLPSFRLLFLSILSAMLVFYGLLYHFSFVFFTLTWVYVAGAGSLSLFSRWRRGRIGNGGKVEDNHSLNP